MRKITRMFTFIVLAYISIDAVGAKTEPKHEQIRQVDPRWNQYIDPPSKFNNYTDPFRLRPLSHPINTESDLVTRFHQKLIELNDALTPKDAALKEPCLSNAWITWDEQINKLIKQKTFDITKSRIDKCTFQKAVCSFNVSSSGIISNARLVNPSKSALFDLLALKAIDSVNGDVKLLMFPTNSKVLKIHKTITLDNAGRL